MFSTIGHYPDPPRASTDCQPIVSQLLSFHHPAGGRPDYVPAPALERAAQFARSINFKPDYRNMGPKFPAVFRRRTPRSPRTLRRIEDRVADAVLRRRVNDRPEPSEASLLAVDAHHCGTPRSRKPITLQTSEHFAAVVKFGMPELCGRFAFGTNVTVRCGVVL
jgi:hypothetical protein